VLGCSEDVPRLVATMAVVNLNMPAYTASINETNSMLPSLEHIHSSKRGKNERNGLHIWHPYYAGYSEQFVRDVIKELASTNDVILDPWNGSGTTTVVAQQMGYRSIGVEINPVMVIHARAKTIIPAERHAELRERTRRIVQAATRYSTVIPVENDEIYQYIGINALQPLLSLKATILRSRPLNISHSSLGITKRDVLIHQKYHHPITSFFLSAVFQCLRKIGNFHHGSNPTWLLKRENLFHGEKTEVLVLFQEQVQRMLKDLSDQEFHREFAHPPLILEGNVKILPLSDSCIDLIITSPPYCTRIDYIIPTKPELVLLGAEKHYLEDLRRSTMGAPVIVKRNYNYRNNWGSTCLDFLAAVEIHPSKASRSYYLPVLLQYFDDAFSALVEMKRVLKPGGHAILVVQSSYYKEIEILLGQIYKEMAQALDLYASIARREVVRQHMAHLNKKSRRYVSDKVYHEDVILIYKPYRGCK
jgi:DNA modification methylase